MRATNRRPGRRPPAPAADPVVSQYLGLRRQGRPSRAPCSCPARARTGPWPCIHAQHDEPRGDGARGRRACRSRFSRTTRPTSSASSIRRTRPPTRRTASNATCWEGTSGAVNYRASRHQSRPALPPQRRSGRDVDRATAADGGRPAPRRPRPGRWGKEFDGIFSEGAQAARPTSSTPSSRRRRSTTDERIHPAPGLRRDALEHAVLPLHHHAAGWTATRPSPRPRPSARGAATTIGGTSTTTTSSACPTPGSSRGSPLGTSPSTVCRSRSSMPSSPSASSCS